MEVSWVESADLDHRITAEFYRRDLLAAAHKIHSCCPCLALDALRYPTRIITNGIRGPECADTEFRMLRQQDIDQLWVDSSNATRVTEKQYRENKRAWCLPGDILLSIGGYIGTAGKIVDVNPQVTGRHTAVLPLDKAQIDPDYALAFFVTTSGAKLLERFVLGGVQAGIDLDDLREIRVPVPRLEVQRAIGSKVRKAERLRNMVRANHGSCKVLLAELLGPRPTEASAGTRNVTWVPPSLLESRIDCNYNNAKATLARDRVLAYPTTRLLREVSQKIVCGPFGSTLTSDEHDSSGEIVLVQPTDISETFFAHTPGWRITQTTLEEKRLTTYPAGVLLFARVGIYPHCGVLPTRIPLATISSSMIAVSLKEDHDPYYYSLFFRSDVGLPLLFAIQKITAQPTISTEELASIRVPVPPPDVQALIGEKMRRAECYHADQILHLEAARADVEGLIAGSLNEARLLSEESEIEDWLKRNSDSGVKGLN